MVKKIGLGLLLAGFLLCSPAFAHIFSNTFVELHMDFGKTKEHYDGLHSAGRFTMTLEHYSNWAYGDNFFFIDVDSSRNFEFGTEEGGIYMEYSPRFSINKIFGLGSWDAVVTEAFISPQINYGYGSARWGGDGQNLTHFAIGPVFLFGPSFDLKIPGFQVLNVSFLYRYEFRSGLDLTDITTQHDDSGFQFTIVWAAKLGKLFEVQQKSEDPNKKAEPSKAGELWFRGFLDVWNRGAIHNDDATLLTEPQIVLYIANNLAIGTEIEMSYNFSGTAPGIRHFECDPTIFLRLDF